MAEAKVWRNATPTEQLVGDVEIKMRSKTLKTAASILIATWLDELIAQQRRIQRRKKENIIINWADPEELRDADERFKRKIYRARGLSLRTERQGVGEQAEDTSAEESPD